MITRLRARLQSQEYLEQLRDKYMSPSVGETTRVMLSGNLEYLLARRASQAASMAGIAESKLGADASAALAGDRGAASSSSGGPASGAGSAAGSAPGSAPGADPKAAAWLSGRVRWSQRSDSGPLRAQMLAAGREL